jgi:hypothetical protein
MAVEVNRLPEGPELFASLFVGTKRDSGKLAKAAPKCYFLKTTEVRK